MKAAKIKESELVRITKENCELKRGINDAFLYIVEAKSGNVHNFIKNDCAEIQFICSELRNNFEAIRDHFKK